MHQVKRLLEMLPFSAFNPASCSRAQKRQPKMSPWPLSQGDQDRVSGHLLSESADGRYLILSLSFFLLSISHPPPLLPLSRYSTFHMQQVL